MRSSIMREYQKRKKKQLFITATCIPIVLLYLFKSSIQRLSFINNTVFSIVLFFFLACVIAFTALNWRCPGCNSFLGANPTIRRCSRCGTRLQKSDSAASRKER